MIVALNSGNSPKRLSRSPAKPASPGKGKGKNITGDADDEDVENEEDDDEGDDDDDDEEMGSEEEENDEEEDDYQEVNLLLHSLHS